MLQPKETTTSVGSYSTVAYLSTAVAVTVETVAVAAAAAPTWAAAEGCSRKQHSSLQGPAGWSSCRCSCGHQLMPWSDMISLSACTSSTSLASPVLLSLPLYVHLHLHHHLADSISAHLHHRSCQICPNLPHNLVILHCAGSTASRTSLEPFSLVSTLTSAPPTRTRACTSGCGTAPHAT